MTENTLPTDLGRVAYEAESRWLDEIMPGVRTPAWDDLDPEHRGVYERIAGAVAEAERERIRQMADRNGAVCTGDEGTSCYFADLLGPEVRERSGGDDLAIAGQLRRRPGDQQLPVPNDGPSMHDLACDDIREDHGDHPCAAGVIADLQARKQVGLERYGSLLQAHNGRDALRDLYEELQDGLVYAKQAETEREGAPGWAVPHVTGQHLGYWLLAVRELMDAAGTEPG